jgi:hypothetical protein
MWFGRVAGTPNAPVDYCDEGPEPGFWMGGLRCLEAGAALRRC